MVSTLQNSVPELTAVVIFRLCWLCDDASFKIDSRAREKQKRNEGIIRSVEHGGMVLQARFVQTSNKYRMLRRKQTSVDGIQTDNRGLLQQLQQSFVSSVHILYFVTVVTTGMRNEKAFQR
jgi:hypothetical protein